MGSLFTTLRNAAGAIAVYDRVFSVIQNNITNADTPGYVRQEQSIEALPFEPAGGRPGGLIAGPLVSARSEYLDQDVRNQQQLLGDARQRASDLGQVEPLFDLTSDFGIPGALNQFFNSFSHLGVNPNDQVARQTVIDASAQLAQSFNRTASGINQVSSNVANQTASAVAEINRLTAQIASLNQQYRASAAATHDAGLDAQMHQALEDLSGLVNFSIIKSDNGSINVYAAGQSPLVIGNNPYSLSAGFASGQTVILDGQGNDITSKLTSGKLGALIREKNTILPGYLANLNVLAQTLADQVNTTLAQGVDKNGQTPAVNLFSYNLPGDAALSLAVTNITPDQIAAALPGAAGGNGNAIAVFQLANAPVLNGFTFTQYFGNVGAQVGRDVSRARQDQSQYQDLVTQAQQLRSQETGVSLDEEAARLLQFQQAYQAVAKVVTVLDELTQTLLGAVRT